MAMGLVDRTGTRARPARRVPVRPDAELERLRTLDGARLLLERARALVDAGWVQDAFYVVRDRHGELRPVSPFGLLMLTRGDVVGACLVGAVSHATGTLDRRAGRRAQAAVAVDALHEALVGRPVDTPHPSARAGRVRELARWNDEPDRTREDVLALLDAAISRTITAAVR